MAGECTPGGSAMVNAFISEVKTVMGLPGSPFVKNEGKRHSKATDVQESANTGPEKKYMGFPGSFSFWTCFICVVF
jgi:hypothetical protein